MAVATSIAGPYAASAGHQAAEAHHHDVEVQQTLNVLLARSIQPLFDDIPFRLNFRAETPQDAERKEAHTGTERISQSHPRETPIDDKINGRRENIPPANSAAPAAHGGFGESFLEAALQRLSQWRRAHNRVYDIATMSYREVAEEKSQIKKELKSFDSHFRKLHGRDPEKQDKEVIRSLYLRYNEMKAVLNIQEASATKAPSPAPQKQIARPSTQPADAKSAAKSRLAAASTDSGTRPATMGGSHLKRAGANGASEERKVPAATTSNARAAERALSTSPASRLTAPSKQPAQEPSTNGMDIAALKAEKRVLRKTLRNFETQFSERHGRVVQTPADMHPMLPEYQRYKYLRQLLAQHEGKS